MWPCAYTLLPFTAVEANLSAGVLSFLATHFLNVFTRGPFAIGSTIIMGSGVMSFDDFI